MTTRLELEGSQAEKLLARNGCSTVSVNQKIVIAEFANEKGTYETAVGEIVADFKRGNQGFQREVVLSLGSAKSLSGVKYRKHRRISVNREGKGIQEIRKGVTLFISTDASADTFQ